LRALSARRRRRAATLDGIEVPQAESTPARHRRRMSATATKAVSERMKRY
jgi:hypothetical protein